MFSNVIKAKAVRREIQDYLLITFGLALYSISWTTFFLPYHIVTGGVTGIAAIVFYATNIPVSYTYAVINIALLMFAIKPLGLKFLLRTIYAIFMLSVFLWVAQSIMTGADGKMAQLLGPGQDFMSIIIGGTINGSALAIVFLSNGSTGGTDIIAAIVNKFSTVSIGRALLFCDLLIISSCYFVFHGNWRIIIFGLAAMIIENFMLDYVMKSRQQSVQFLIFSRKYQEIAMSISKVTSRGVTILDGHGWYTGQEVKVLCVLARKREQVNIFRMIKSIDPNAFVSQSNVVGVYGEGFDTIKVSVKKNLSENNPV
jgi:uncharacterized membrane-anchored protein YitT (DUF2179 family)